MKPVDDPVAPPSPAPQESVRKGVRRIVAAARKLRRTSTDVERKLWHRIRDKQIDNFRFRRQRPIGKYIVDFICLDAKLVIELDGGQHTTDVAYDERRTAFLRSLGYRVLRIWNSEVIENLDGVLERLRSELLSANANPTLALPLAGEGIDRGSGDVDTIANTTPSPDKRGVERGIRDACVTPAERLDDAAASAPCKGVGMGVRRNKLKSANDAKGNSK